MSVARLCYQHIEMAQGPHTALWLAVAGGVISTSHCRPIAVSVYRLYKQHIELDGLQGLRCVCAAPHGARSVISWRAGHCQPIAAACRSGCQDGALCNLH